MQRSAQRSRRVTLRLLPVVVLLPVSGLACATRVEPTSEKAEGSAAAAAPRAEAPGQARAERRHFRGPVGVVIDVAKREAVLSEDQLAHLASIEKELELGREGRRALGDKLRASAVAMIRSGQAGGEELDRSVNLATGAMEERITANADALEEIHGLLEPDQRSAVARALRARVTERYGPRPANEERQPKRFDRLAQYLFLTSFQLDKLKAAQKELFPERQTVHPSRDELFALVDAFEGDDFRDALNSLREKKVELLRARVKAASERATSVLAIFTPEQRTLLADLILEGPEKVLLGKELDEPRDAAAEAAAP